MKENWEIVPFGNVCEISGGSQPPKSNFIYEPKEGYIRLIQVRDFRTDKYITYIPKEKAKKFCEASDIMIGRYGPPIFGIFSGLEGAYNVALMKAIPNEEILNKEYFRWFLRNDALIKFVEKTSKRAAGQDGVRKERLYQYPVPIPPLLEQKAIVKILDEAFAKIDQSKANIEKNIENAKELFQSKRNSLFDQARNTGKTQILGELSRINTGKLNANAMVENAQYPFFTCSRQIYRIDEFAFDCEAILLAGNNASGDFNVKHYKGKFNAYQRTYVIEVNDKEVLDYTYLKNRMIQNLANFKRQSVGAGTKFLKLGMIKEMKIPVPEISEQRQISKQLILLDSQIEKYHKKASSKLIAIEELKKSLLQKAFSGELTKSEAIA